MAQKLVTLASINITSGGTAQAVSATATPITTIVIQANPANAGSIYAGDSNVSSTRGIILEPGDIWSFSMDMRSYAADELILSDWYVDGTTNDDVQVSYLKRRE